jgi:hypothetical protein
MRFALIARVAVIGLISCAAVPSRAQADQGSIIGDVIDGETGGTVAGVAVSVTSVALQGRTTIASDASGKYRLDALPVGSYALSFTKEGFTAEPITGVQLRAGATLRVDAVVTPTSSSLDGSAMRVVRVTAPVVDVGSTQIGGTIDAAITRRIPLIAPGAKGSAQRSFEAAATALPQVHSDSFGASVNGATSVENQYVIDGISVNNTGFGYLGSPLSMEFIEEVSVITGGYLPEYGRAMGGLLNVVTKSGGNVLHGGVFLNAAPGFLEGDRRLALNQGSAIRVEPELSGVSDIGFELGGPVATDALWFYVGAAINRSSFRITRRVFTSAGSEVSGASDEFLAESTGAQLLAKLTWLANADNRVSFTFVATPSVSGGPGQLGIDARTGEPEVSLSFEGSQQALGHIYEAGGVDGSVKWQSTLLERRLRLDTSLGVHVERSSLGGLPSDGSRIGGGGLASAPRTSFRRSIPGSHSIADFEALPNNSGCDPAGTDDAIACPVTTYQFGGPDALDEQTGQSLQLRHVTTYLLEAAGMHVIKGGAELGLSTFDNLRAYSGGRRYVEDEDGAVFFDGRQYGYLIGPDRAVLLDALRWQTTSLFVAGFLQDSWTLSDVVTWNVGVRYDGQWMFAGDGTASLALPLELSPRTGVIIDPWQTGRVKLFASFARYYEAVPNDLVDRSGSSEPEVESDHPASSCDPRDPQQHSSPKFCLNDDERLVVGEPSSPNQRWFITAGGRTAIDPDIQPPSSDEIVLGAEAEVFPAARVGITYTRRWIGCPWSGADGLLCTRAIEDMSRDEASTYFIGNPGFGIAKDFPIAQRDYDALTLLFHKQWSDGWLLQASYTLAWLRGNYAGLFRPETDQLDPNQNSDFDLVSLTRNRTGPLPFDRTHQLKGFFAKQFDAAYDTHFTLGASAQLTSGTPSNLLGSDPLYLADEVFILPRGSGERLPWVGAADVHAAFTFKPFGNHQDVEVSVDVFNVANFQAPTLLDETYTDADVNPLTGCVPGVADSCTTADLDRLKSAENDDFDARSKNPGFGQPTEFQPPRTVRLGLRWSF